MTDPATRPIGYWLKHLHDLIDGEFHAVLGATGVERRDWQLLNTLHGGGRSRAELAGLLAPFHPNDPAGGHPALDSALDGPSGLITRGWVTADGAGRLTLTATGRQVHAQVSASVNAIRHRVTQGLGAGEYQRTVRSLAIMAANLERGPAGGPPGTPAA